GGARSAGASAGPCGHPPPPQARRLLSPERRESAAPRAPRARILGTGPSTRYDHRFPPPWPSSPASSDSSRRALGAPVSTTPRAVVPSTPSLASTPAARTPASPVRSGPTAPRAPDLPSWRQALDLVTAERKPAVHVPHGYADLWREGRILYYVIDVPASAGAE